MCPCNTIFVANSQQYIVWIKIINFSFMPKIIRILRSCSMKIFCTFLTVNISKRNFWLVICIAKNFIWTTLKMIFSIFTFFCTFRFQIFKYCPNHTSMERLLIRLSDDIYNWFSGSGSHILDIVLWCDILWYFVVYYIHRQLHYH